MKKLLLSSAVFMFLTVVAAAQGQKTSEITICKHTENTFTLADLEKCSMLVPVDEKIKVKSFVVSLLIKEKSGDVFKDIAVNGNYFSKEALDAIKSSKDKISKIVIDEVIVWNADKQQRKISGMEITLK
jgi:hypothetical protein